MKSLLIAVFILALTLLPYTPATMAAPEPPVLQDICDLQGAVFFESVAAFADYRIFVQDIEGFADLVVYWEDTEGFANQPGYWYRTEVKGFADFTVYVEEVENFADFSVAYTDYRTAAGCQ